MIGILIGDCQMIISGIGKEVKKMNIERLSFSKIKIAGEEICEEEGRNVVLNVFMTTEFDGDKKGGVTGVSGRYDIVVSGDIPFQNILRVVAHELVHVLWEMNEHPDGFDDKVNEIERRLKEKLEVLNG